MKKFLLLNFISSIVFSEFVCSSEQEFERNNSNIKVQITSDLAASETKKRIADKVRSYY